ncbi:MAG: RNA polymerase sigma factor, partial [Limisphaerales bacterium]
MKDLDDLELLQEFAKAGSEELFSKLVHRYAPLVYSVGLRVVGSPEAARDVTQSVFIDLLHKLPRVITSLKSERSSEAARASLAGWLHRAARYEALELIRSENRRQARERIAMQLQEQSFVSGSEWSSVRPVLDEALDSLDESDRRAVLLRYFQDASFRDIGATFGISEDAAQKRISRALDRLRDILVRKGIATSAVSLAAGQSSGAIESNPPDLANSISAAGLRAEAGIIPNVPSTPKPSFLPRFTLPLAVAFTALVAILWFVNPPLQSLQENAATPSVPAENPQQFPPSSNLAADSDLPSTTLTALEATMGLRVVSADTGQPLNDVLCIVTGTMDGIRVSTHAVFRTDADGHARIAYTNNLFGMGIWLSHDGYASTLVSWKPGRGQAIPQDYTLRMASAPLIGGFVVDEHGAPVSDVMIQFNLPEKLDGNIGGRVESFHCQFKPEVFTDANG